MLRLTDIVKTYRTGDTTVQALRGVSITFRQNEFVSVLGPSGCGKTTLLNIIGGLDRYDSGDLSVSGRSTRQFQDSDWDSYRNHSIGFVFQNYNLIPHQTVLSNVELALTLSGVSKGERRKRAVAALERVGLSDQLGKKPNQMSGGQMQRVAIARALVNDPEILLADEPTGALDSETSVQIMEILKEIAEDRLVIMVTHNPDLAEQYSTRIVRLLDGQVISDTDPYEEPAAAPQEAPTKQALRAARKTAKKERKAQRTSMSFWTALTLSMNNLMTKKGRTFMTSFAGSIGIIGIALILSLSNGFQVYIDNVQKNALSAYPLAIQKETVDFSSMLQAFAKQSETSEHELDKVYSNPVMTGIMHAVTAQVSTNDLKSFKSFIEKPESGVKELLSAPPQYTYNFDLNIYKSNTENGVVQLSPSNVMTDLMGMSGGSADSTVATFSSMAQMSSSMGGGMSIWSEILDNRELLDTQYEVIAGKWPEKYDEVVLVTDQNNEIPDVALYAIGLLDQEELLNIVSSLMNGSDVAPQTHAFTYDEILDTSFSLVLPADYYVKNADGAWEDMRYDDAHMEQLVQNGLPLHVTGIIRPAEGATATSIIGTVGYTHELTEYIIAETDKREIVKAQKADPDTDVFTGLTFKDVEEKQALAARTQKDTPEESTTAPNPENVSAGLPAATVGTLNMTQTPSVRFIATTMTEDEIYAYIDANTPEDQREDVKEFVRLALKNTRTLSERKKMADYMASMPTDPSMPMSDQKITGDQLNSYLLMMTKEQKLAVITAMITGDTSALESVLPKEMLEQASQQSGESTTATADESTTAAVQDGEPTTEAAAETGETEPQTEPVTEPPAPVIEAAESLSVNQKLLGMADLDDPDGINLYPVDFPAKTKLSAIIEQYNQEQRDAGKEERTIEYTDYIGIFLSSVTTIINVVSYVLIAFVAISLIVSSIMIGIITYISVLERTKEIGILRSIGASKRDISRVFNAETLIVGLAAGVIGIGVTLLLNIPINLIIQKIVDIPNVSQLPVAGAVALIVISVLLTVIAGLIPSRYAAKRDPVEALRTE